MRIAVVAVVLAGAALVGLAGAHAGTQSTRVLVTVWPQGRGPAKPHSAWTLRCAPARGTLPRARRACRALLANRRALRQTPAGASCTEVVGGPQVASIHGAVAGRPVRAIFDRHNGCEIARWNRLRALFPVSVTGPSSTPASPPAGTDPSPPGSPTPDTELEIAIYFQGVDGPAVLWTLSCNPTGGTLPNAEQACQALAALADPFAPVPPGSKCTMQFGTPRVAQVTGRFRDAPVDATFNRGNGCEIARWNELAFLFPAQ